jgi:diguanylate cyclase (GGDEF)-like protein
MVYRYGGEEFLILLPEQTVETAAVVLERIRRAIEDLALPHPDNPPNDVVTISGGVAATDPETLLGVNDWLRNADQALYRAKATGRNRVVVFDTGLEAA